MSISGKQQILEGTAALYQRELVKSNRALARLSHKNKQLRSRVRELNKLQESNKFVNIMKELYDRVTKRVNACVNCSGGGSCHSPEKCQSKEKQHGESTLPTAPPLS